MKTKTLSLLLSIIFFASMHSQSTDNKKNIIKTNLTAYLFNNYNITYERSLASWFSLGLSYGHIPEGKLPLSNQLIDPNESEIKLDNTNLSMTQLTIEPRFYLGSGYGHGFYLAPYYRQSTVNVNNIALPVEVDASVNDLMVDIAGKTTANSFGLMIGAQWFIGKKNNWVIDWWIVGAHYGSATSAFDVTSKSVLTTKEQASLDVALQEINLEEFNLDSTIKTNNRGATMTISSPWAGLRSGLSFGYRF